MFVRHLVTGQSVVLTQDRQLTKMANVGFQPPSSCVFGLKPRASVPCKLECQTFSMTPAGIPS